MLVDCGDFHCFLSFAMPLLTRNHSVPDGKVCLNEKGELAVTKFAVEPVRTVAVLIAAHMLTVSGLVSAGSCREVRHWYVAEFWRCG